MKKRFLAFCCAVLMLAQTVALPAHAVDNLYFTAVNETILELSDSTMPFWSGGYLYVSSSMFSNRELGLYYSYNTAKQTAVVYTSNQALIFNLSNQTVIDGQDNVYFPTAIAKGSVIFLPVGLLANYFGLTYTNKRVDHGYLIRLRSASSTLSDSMLLDAGSYQLQSRYNQYLASHSENGQSSATGTSQDDAESGQHTVYLCFLASEAEQTNALLNVLTAQSVHAAFYFAEPEIRSSGDLLRHMTATGQSIGLVCDASNTEIDVVEQLRIANIALEAATGSKSRLCYIQNASDDILSAVEEAGYCCLSPQLDRSAYGLRSASNANYLLSRINAQRGAVSVWLGDQVTVSGLRSFISSAKNESDTLRGITEVM